VLCNGEKKTLLESKDNRMTPALSEANRMVDQYEALRKEATDGGAMFRNAYGVALFLSRGMTDWLLASAQLVSPTMAIASTQDYSPVAVSVADQTNLTLLLADMVLACKQEIQS
jgi:hypothetical protein